MREDCESPGSSTSVGLCLHVWFRALGACHKDLGAPILPAIFWVVKKGP